MALMVSELVVLLFIGGMVFSTSNNPFIATDPQYLGENGALIGTASTWGMNLLLKHWAMVLHPPALFVGYAGFVLPMAYALAALIINDPSDTWVRRCNAATLFAWLMLGVGIGLGAMWAYAVLGWGGYWGWDSVENASLLPWLVGVALLHTFTIYRKRGSFRRWAVLCSCLAFAFVILGTFITRTGIVASVHAFQQDTVSFGLFIGLMALVMLAAIGGLAWRWQSFGPRRTEADGDQTESLISRDVAYYFNNIVMLIAAFLLAYMTLTSILPSWLPFGGMSLDTSAYQAIARPAGVLYCALLAFCPLLAWGKTGREELLRRARPIIPGALIVFVLLLVFFATNLAPRYETTLATGGSAAIALAGFGPRWYYYALTILACAVAAWVASAALVQLVSALRRSGTHEQAEPKEEETLPTSEPDKIQKPARRLHLQLARIGGSVAHLGIAFCLVGLVGSSMYVSEVSVAVPPVEGAVFVYDDFTFEYRGFSAETLENGDELARVGFAVYNADGRQISILEPGIQYALSTQQQKLVVAIYSTPTYDIFAVFNGLDSDGKISLDLKINPLISCVWIGFGLLILGPAIACFARRQLTP
jgi:cytochrome c-type biogenesis protein CcmF